MVRNLARISWLEMEKCDKKNNQNYKNTYIVLNYNVKKKKYYYKYDFII